MILALPDLLALAWFLTAWLGYSILIEFTPKRAAPASTRT